MLNNSRHQPPIRHHLPKHLRHRLLLKHTLLLALHRQTDTDRTTLGRRDLRAQAGFGEVDLARVGFVDLDHRREAGDLDREGGGVGDGDGGDDVVHEHGGFLAVDWRIHSKGDSIFFDGIQVLTHVDGVDFSFDDDCCALAAEYVDGLREGDVIVSFSWFS
jgi:hypothetical protein